MRPTLLPILTVILAACGQQHDPAPSTTDEAPTSIGKVELDGLLGEWHDVQDGGKTVFHENWERNESGILVGLGFVLSGQDTVFIEHLGIVQFDGATHYAATIRSQNSGEAVLFKLVHDQDSLVFTNPEHDFPQRIVYVPVDNDHWNVTVSGKEKGITTTDRLHFSRRSTSATGSVQ